MLALVGGTVHTITNGVLSQPTILIREGRFEALLPSRQVPAEAETLDLSGCIVLPGLIDARTSVGLIPEGSGQHDADHEELTDPDTAWLRAIDALNPKDLAFADAREAGITTLLVGPAPSNVAAGLSAIVKTAGSTVDDLLVRQPAGLQLALGWPPVIQYRDQNKLWTRMGAAALLRERLTSARGYLRRRQQADASQDAGPAGDKDLEERIRLEPYADLLRRRFPARVRVATAEDAWTALRLADEYGFDLVLEQLAEGHLAGLPEELKRRNVPCVLGPMMKAGKTPETKALSYRTAVHLAHAGVRIALSTGHPSRPVRYLLLEAALAVRAGLDEERALRAVTLDAAAALGLEARLGSIQPGKEADLVVFDGDPWLPTSQVSHTLIGGEIVYARAASQRQSGSGLKG
jgi:imidazolonepropionase-like amidohydrolase